MEPRSPPPPPHPTTPPQLEEVDFDQPLVDEDSTLDQLHHPSLSPCRTNSTSASEMDPQSPGVESFDSNASDRGGGTLRCFLPSEALGMLPTVTSRAHDCILLTQVVMHALSPPEGTTSFTADNLFRGKPNGTDRLCMVVDASSSLGAWPAHLRNAFWVSWWKCMDGYQGKQVFISSSIPFFCALEKKTALSAMLLVYSKWYDQSVLSPPQANNIDT